jgi:hypothetical protein
MVQREEYSGYRWPSPVRWGPAFGGTIFTFAATLLVMTLWLAIGYGSSHVFFVRDLRWFFLGTFLGAILVGGFLAGWVSGVRGTRAGVFTGLMVWGLTVVGMLVPLSFAILFRSANVASAGSASRSFVTLHGGDTWAFFGALAGGLLCALLGATLGASPARRAMDARWGGDITEATWTGREATAVRR